MKATYLAVLGLVIALVGVGIVATVDPVVATGVVVVVAGVAVVAYSFVSLILEKFGMGVGDLM